MNYSTAIMLVNENIRAIRCVYEPKKEGSPEPKNYLFKSLDPTIEEGDLVIVPSTTRHQRAVVKVVEVNAEVDFDSPIQIEWIVGKLNNSDYAAIKKAENEAIDKIKSAEKLRKKRELRDKLLEHDTALLKGLPIANMKKLPGAKPDDYSAEGAAHQPPFSYEQPTIPVTEKVEF